MNLWRSFFLAACLCLLGASELHAFTITLSPKGPATAWTQPQTIRGNISRGLLLPSAPSGTLYVNGAGYPFTITDSTFAVNVRLGDGTSKIVARIDSAGTTFTSDTLLLSLGYRVGPECYAYATVSGLSVTLHAAILDNPDSSALTFAWTADPQSPTAVTLLAPRDSVSSTSFPLHAPRGEYYFTVTVTTSHGDTVKARTFVTVDSNTVHPFSITTDHARWIDSAIVYCISPFMFTGDTRFRDITAKLPEIAQLGPNAIWIQPIYVTSDPDQGYHVLNYFAFRSSLGTDADLRNLVSTAHGLGMRVLLDFEPNHPGVQHPYAQDAIANGSLSHYYDFFQRTIPPGQYSNQLHPSHAGKMDFLQYFSGTYDPVYYFPVWNYGNPELQRMIIEAGKYWMEQYGIDGYRADAVWGVNDRNPQFMKDWRLALKRVKPDALLLAEDKASWPSTFDGRFDAAYDWASETSWVSHWPLQVSYTDWSQPSKTIFNTTPENQRAAALREALTNKGAGFAPGSKVFRFMENNDLPHFIADHSLATTKMAAALLFSLPGIPLIFNGQETGATAHPYDATPLYGTQATIRSYDKLGLFEYYRSLTGLRKRYTALTGDNFAETAISPQGSFFAFRRWQGTQNLFTVLNMGSAEGEATLSVPVGDVGLDSARVYFLTDLLTGQSYSGRPGQLAATAITMPPTSARILVLDTTVVTGIDRPLAGNAVPGRFTLDQNYPNPFNPTTTIRYALPHRSNVTLAVFNTLGQQVAELVNSDIDAGSHEVQFNARNLASGVYFYRMQAGSFVDVKKLVLCK